MSSTSLMIATREDRGAVSAADDSSRGDSAADGKAPLGRRLNRATLSEQDLRGHEGLRPYELMSATFTGDEGLDPERDALLVERTAHLRLRVVSRWWRIRSRVESAVARAAA
jgi:hypothetical protein